MTRKEIYRRALIVVLLFSIVGLGFFGFLVLKDSIPSRIRLVAGKEQTFEFDFPTKTVSYQETVQASQTGKSNILQDELHVSSTEPFTVVANKTGSYMINCKLFGVIDLKNIQVDVLDKKQYLTPGGVPIGIYLETDGILAIGTGVVAGVDGVNYEPAYNIIQSGDYIMAVNSQPIQTKQELIDKINEYGENEIVLDVKRKNEIIQLSIEPVRTGTDEFKLGIWVRDNTQGIGTLTFIDENNNFGALGHGINDVDTSTLMSLRSGKLYNADIVDIVKGERGTPGELAGIIHYNDNDIIGDVTANTTNGIFGTITDQEAQDVGQDPMEICLKQDIEIGPATILSSVDGTVKEYEIKIKEIHLNDNDANKGLVLEVIDEELLSLTGGIVQGMSGSPIIQNGKLVGAVTHVFVQDSTSGFGIFIENMIQS
jgi:stage IV sporulation protein B